jgi:hypothetical protein
MSRFILKLGITHIQNHPIKSYPASSFRSKRASSVIGWTKARAAILNLFDGEIAYMKKQPSARHKHTPRKSHT